MEAEVEGLLAARTMHEPVTASRVKLRGFEFKPVKGWFTSELTERLAGWSCRVYEASGTMAAVHRVKAPWR